MAIFMKILLPDLPVHEMYRYEVIWRFLLFYGLLGRLAESGQQLAAVGGIYTGPLPRSGMGSERASSFLDTWIIYDCQVSPHPPFHDYQKYIPVKCTPRFSSLLS